MSDATAWTDLGRVARKYGNILRVSLIERLTYRADFFVATAFRFLPLVTSFLLWEAVYAGARSDAIGGYTRNQMLAYLLLVQVSRMFSSMPGLAGGIARDVREGSLKKYLLQPIDLTGYLLAQRTAHKLAYIATVALPYGLLFWWFREVLPPAPDASTATAYALSLLLAFLLGFFFELCVGMSGFWLLEVTSLIYIVNTVNFFVSGHMFPLDLLPEWFASTLKLLPFHYLAYYPATVLLGIAPPEEVWLGVAKQATWVVGLALLSRWLYKRGLERYSAFGG